MISGTHPNPVILLGNQKSGTTVIAALLGQLTGFPVTLDFEKEIKDPTFPEVLTQKKTFLSFVEHNRESFSRPIIKEPGLTLLYPELAAFFPRAQFVYIVRDPRSNLRSILNRLDIPGTLPDLDPARFSKLPKVWQMILDESWRGEPRRSYLETLALRWNRMTSVYLQNRESFTLVRYEDFLQDKSGSIRKLAEQLGLPGKYSIENKVDVQYQPRGDRDISPDDFFGAKNLTLIQSICAKNMPEFGY